MRLTSVVLHASMDHEDLEFSLREARTTSRYVVRQILGIDAEELIPKYYGFGAESGARYHDRVMKPRDIVIRIGLNPMYGRNETVSEIRDEIYRLIAANRSSVIQLQFKDGATLVSVIDGMITKMEVGYFAQLPELQITVHCPDPTFRSIHPVYFEPEDLPLTNPITLPDNTSTAHHGFSFRIKFTAAVSELVIQDHETTPDWHFTITPTGGFDVDDELEFSSEYGAKLVYLSTSSLHLMDKVESDSIWPTIFPGSNQFWFLPIEDFEWLELKYFAAYWGV